MINPVTQSFLFAGIYGNILASTFTKISNVLFIMLDYHRSNLENYRAKILSPNLSQINQSQLRLSF
jgi:hypothetical protein